LQGSAPDPVSRGLVQLGGLGQSATQGLHSRLQGTQARMGLAVAAHLNLAVSALPDALVRGVVSTVLNLWPLLHTRRLMVMPLLCLVETILPRAPHSHVLGDLGIGSCALVRRGTSKRLRPCPRCCCETDRAAATL
jgi:hypothetical protein